MKRILRRKKVGTRGFETSDFSFVPVTAIGNFTKAIPNVVYTFITNVCPKRRIAFSKSR